MEGEEGEEEKYSQELIDSLKLDALILTPKQSEWLRNFGRNLRVEVVERYRKFIPEETIKENEDIEDRVTVVNFDNLRTISKDFYGLKRLGLEKTGQATFFADQGFSLLSRLEKKYWLTLPEETKSDLVRKAGTVKKARSDFFLTNLLYCYIHEFFHAFQEKTLPSAFTECAVAYYLGELGIFEILGRCVERKINFYRDLIGKYGDEVHQLFFGSVFDLKKRFKIIGEVNRNVRSLFSEDEQKLYKLGGFFRH